MENSDYGARGDVSSTNETKRLGSCPTEKSSTVGQEPDIACPLPTNCTQQDLAGNYVGASYRRRKTVTTGLVETSCLLANMKVGLLPDRKVQHCRAGARIACPLPTNCT